MENDGVNAVISFRQWKRSNGERANYRDNEERVRLIRTKTGSLERANGVKRILPSENCEHSNQKSRLPAKCKIEWRTSAQFSRW